MSAGCDPNDEPDPTTVDSQTKVGISYCEHQNKIYTVLPVTLQWKTLRFVFGAALLSLTLGCSGINHTHSVSPASFFLPGLLKADPPPANDDMTLPATPTVQQVALVR